MRKTLTILLFLIGQLCYANMASPIRNGTFSSAAFSSRDIDIIKEKINLQIAADFKTASYIIEYFIKTDTAGKQIPLLFHAKDYQGDFNVWVDNQKVKLLEIPADYKTTSNTPFSKFSNSFSTPSNQGESETTVIYWEKYSGIVYELKDLKYFEIDLTKGEHTIRVEYVANAWTDISHWVKEYSFRYSLSPAKNWKSFGLLEIILNTADFHSSVSTNLGQPTSGKLDSMPRWNFTKLPADYFQIIYTPEISALGKAMIAISPIGQTMILAILLSLFHFFSIRIFRKSNPTKKYSWVVIAGSIVIPFLILLGYIFSYELIDSAIGSEAGKYHGYTFLVIILYPIFMPVYWLIMRFVDIRIKRKETE